MRKALQLYESVLSRDPGHADAHYNLAGICFEHKRYDLARKHYTEVVKLRPGDGHTYNNLGSVHEMEGRPDKARGFYQKAVQVDPTVGAAYFNLSRLLLKDGEPEAAMAQLEKALRLEPDNPAFVNQSARLEGELGKIPNLLVLLIVAGFAGVIIVYWFAFRRPRRGQ
jgi:tetratricopeptide (TPR) repeat protein